MKSYEMRETATGIHIEGAPNAVKLVALEGKQAERLGHLALHRSDLQFVLECLGKLTRRATKSYERLLGEPQLSPSLSVLLEAVVEADWMKIQCIAVTRSHNLRLSTLRTFAISISCMMKTPIISVIWSDH